VQYHRRNDIQSFVLPVGIGFSKFVLGWRLRLLPD
jgi:hypothetical protein